MTPSPENSEPQQNYLAGILWMLLSGLLFVGVTVIVRYLGTNMPAVEAALIRYVFGLIFLIPMIIRFPWRELNRNRLTLYSLRGLAHGVAVMLWFYVMARIPIAEITAVGYTTPIFTAVGAVLIFRERIHARRFGAILVGLIGMLVILRPGLEVVQAGSLSMVVAALCFAVSYLFTKKLTFSESPTNILVMLSIVCTLVLLPGGIMQWRDPTATELFWLALTALFATCGHYAMTRSIAAAPLTVIQPFSFLQLVWAVTFGFLLFGEIPDIWVITGGLIILCAVTYLTYRESVSRRTRLTG